MGGSTSGKGATTSSSAPPGQAMQSYEGLMHRANQLSNQPYNPYTGQLVANLTPQQQQAFSEYGNAYGAAQPYIDQAAAYGSLGASPIQASQIQNYLNPYQQDVIGATESQMNNIDAAQLAQTQGQGMGAGGLFNDRLGVAQGQVANQQALANNQTLAGLNVQNYSQALAAAQADRAAAAQGAYTFGNLGQENLQSILAGAGANLQAGNAQQQQQQNVLNSTYGQWQQAQAYPYQQIGWASGIDTGLGSNMGGTSTTTPPGSNQYTPYIGAAVAGAGMLAGVPPVPTGNPNMPVVKTGGRIRGFDAGGATPYGAGASWIPNVQITHGSGPPKPPSSPQQQAGQMPKMPGGVGKGSAGAGTAASGTGIAGEAGDALGSFGDMVGGATAAGDVGDFAALALLANKGGRVDVGRPRGLEWGHGIRGYADGGTPYNAVPAALPGLMDEPEDPDAPRGLGSVPFGPPDPEAFSPHSLYGEPPVRGVPSSMNPDDYYPPGYDVEDTSTPPDGLHAPLEDGPGAPRKPAGETLLARGDEPPPDNGTAPDGLHRPFEPLPGRQDRAEAGLGDIPRVAPPQQSRGNGIGNALMAAGLSLMANRSPYLGPALGEAGLAGLSSYTGEQRHQEQQEHQATKEKLDQEKVNRQMKMLEDRAKRADADKASVPHVVAHNTDQWGNSSPVYGVWDAASKGFVDPITRRPVQTSPQTGQPVQSRPVEEKGINPRFDAEEIQHSAKLYNVLGPDAFRNFGRGKEADARKNAIRAEAQRMDRDAGITPEERQLHWQENHARGMGMGAAERSLAQQESKMGTAAFAAKGAIQLGRGIIEKVPRTSFLKLNELIQGVRKQASNPDEAELFARTQGIVNEYSAVMARGANVTTDASRHRAEELLNTASTPEVYNRVLDTITSEIDMALKAPGQMRKFFADRYGQEALARPGTEPAAPTAPAPVAPTVLPERARAALKEGVPTKFNNGQVWTLKGGQPTQVSP